MILQVATESMITLRLVFNDRIQVLEFEASYWNIVSTFVIFIVWLVAYVCDSLSFLRQSIQIFPLTSSFGFSAFLVWVATNFHMPFPAFPAHMIFGNITFISHVTRFTTLPTFTKESWFATMPLTTGCFTIWFSLMRWNFSSPTRMLLCGDTSRRFPIILSE